MGEVHQHLHQQQQKEEQQKFMSEAHWPSPIFLVNHNHQYNYQQQQQIFQQLQNLPKTHELFHYQQNFQAYFQHQQQEYQEQQWILQDQQSAVSQDSFRNIAGIPLNFKPDFNENSTKSEVQNRVLSEEGYASLRGSKQYVPETPGTALAMSYCWQNQEDFAIRQTFRKPFCTDLSGRKNKRGIEAKDREEWPEMNQNKDYCYDEQTEQSSSMCGGKSRLFAELEVICGHAAVGKSNQTGSAATLNGENLTKSTRLPPTLGESNHVNANAMALAAARFGHEHGSETSAADGEEPSSRVNQKRKKRKKMKDEIGSMAHFFDGLVKRLMDHQEVLYKKFVEIIERIDRERKEREEAGRRQELEKVQLEVAAKAHERALASRREASIVAYLEKITGQSIKLPPREQPLLEFQPEISVGNITELSTSNRIRNFNNVMSKRWPKADVEALIQIRSKLESKFREPGLKGPLWEEISNSMASMGFQRSAKRCKEKWENINKYFKKSKENPKGRRQKVKTCEYFDQLDQLYSKSIINGFYGYSSSSAEHQFLHSDDAATQEHKELPFSNRETPNKSPYIDFEGPSYEEFEELRQEIHANKDDKHEEAGKEEAYEDIGQVEGVEEEDDEGNMGEEVD